MSNDKKPISSNIIYDNSKPNYEESEVDFIEIINQLWIGKKIIVISIFAMLLLAATYISLVKEKWTSEAIISQPSAGQVATYNNALSVLYTQNIEDKIALPDLQKQIFSRYSSSAYALSGILRNLENPLEFKVNPTMKGKDDPLSITFTASSAKEAQEQLSHYIAQLNTTVSNDFAIDMRTNISVKSNGIKDSLEAQEKIAKDKKEHRIEVIKQSIKVATSAKINATQLSQAEYLSDDTLYLLGIPALTSMIENEKTKPLELNDFYYDSQRTLLSLENLRIDFSKLQNFQFIKKPDLPLYRDSPKKALALVIAVILGGLIGSCIVIVSNIFQNYRRIKIQ